MGGPGSGKLPSNLSKGLVEDHLVLDVHDLHREWRLEPGECSFRTWWHGHRAILSVRIIALEDALELAYSPGGRGGKNVRYDVPLDWTACNFGGERPWFLCPGATHGVACDRRVAKLYFKGVYFLCRHCHDLGYASQREALRTAPLRKARDIRWWLGGSEDIRDPFPERPKGMHRATYARLHDEYLDALEEHLGETAAYLGRIDWATARLLEILLPDR